MIKNSCSTLVVVLTQYSAFDAFSDDREITVEFMLVDWNTKSEYRACIVSASDGTTTILNTLNFQ